MEAVSTGLIAQATEFSMRPIGVSIEIVGRSEAQTQPIVQRNRYTMLPRQDKRANQRSNAIAVGKYITCQYILLYGVGGNRAKDHTRKAVRDLARLHSHSVRHSTPAMR